MNLRVVRCVGVLCVASVFFQSGLLAQETEIKRFGAPQTDRQVQTEASRAERAAGRLTLGGRVGESTSEGYLDILQPLFGGQHGLLFLNPKLSGNDDDESEWSVGLGGRVLLPKPELILGANVFYDERETRHNNTFDQIGAGVEMLSKWVDVRGNYYWPDDRHEVIDSDSETSVEQSTSRSWWGDIYARRYQLKQNRYTRVSTRTTTRYFNRFEAAMEGYDVEVGLRIPFLPEWLETRVFGGYYSFEGDFSDDIDGYKGRLEIRALPALVLDGEMYENKDLTGSDYFVGMRVDLPFDLWNLARGRNPFEGIGDSLRPTRREMRDRLSDMVMRDPHVRMHESDWIEDVGRMTVSSSSRTLSKGYVVLDDVNFVNNANVSGIENGSAEHPWHLVQEGVDAVFGQRNVYVFQGIAPYDEHVMVGTPGVKLRGEGTPIPGFGGKVFGGSKYPVMSGVQGGVNGPAMRIEADDVFVTGFNFARPAGGTNPGATDPLGLGYTIDRVGILALNATRLTVENSRFSGQDAGVGILASGLPEVEAIVRGNEFTDSTGAQMGIGIALSDVDSAGFEVAGNRILGGAIGIGLEAINSGDVALMAVDNTIQDVASSGLYASAGDLSGDFALYLEGNSIIGSGSHNAFVELGVVAGDVDVVLRSNVIQHAFAMGFGLDAYMSGGNGIGGDLNLTLVGNDISFNGDSGLGSFIEQIDGDMNLTLVDNVFNGNSFAGAVVETWGVDGDASVLASGNTAAWNGDSGIEFDLNDVLGDLTATLSDNRLDSNGRYGLRFESEYTDGEATILAERNEATGNGEDGLHLHAIFVNGDLSITARDNFAIGNEEGILLSGDSTNGDVRVLVEGAVAALNSDEGVDVDVFSEKGMVDITLRDVTSARNGQYGVYVSGDAATTANLLMEDIQAILNVEDGVVVGFGGDGAVTATVRRIAAIENGVDGLYMEVESVASNATLSVSDAFLNGNFGNGADIWVASETDAAVQLRDVMANENAAMGFELLAQSYNGNATVELEDGEFLLNGEMGFSGAAEVSSGNGSARVNASGDIVANLNSTGALFLALSPDGTATVNVVVGSSSYANGNAVHGLVVAAQGVDAEASVNIDAGEASDNGRYGVVAVAVGTNSASATAQNANGTGNGDGDSFFDAANSGTWQALLP